MAWEEAFCSHYSIDELPISGLDHSAVLLDILGDPGQPLPLAVAAYLTVHSLRSASTALDRCEWIFPDCTWLVIHSGGTASCLAHNAHKDFTFGHFFTESYSVNLLFLVFVFDSRST